MSIPSILLKNIPNAIDPRVHAYHGETDNELITKYGKCKVIVNTIVGQVQVLTWK